MLSIGPPAALGGYLLAVNVLTYLAFRSDKRRSEVRAWRTPEKTLLTLALVGGWPAAKLAQRRLRHKTRKTSYRFVFWCAVLLNIVAVSWLTLSPDAATLRGLLGFPVMAGEAMIRWS